MAQTTVMDIYIKGKIVFSYIREKNNFNRDDIKIEIYDKENGN